MTTYNIVLVKDQRNPLEGYLKLRSITNRKAKDTTLKIKVKISNWNKTKQRVNAREPNHEIINEKIKEVLNEVRSTDNHLILNKDKSFIAFAEEIITLDSYHTSKKKGAAIRKLKEYLNGSDLPFSQIDLIFIKKYYKFLDDNLKTSSANEYISSFKFLVNQADELGKYNYTRNPFKGFKKKKSDSEYKVLSNDELKLLFSYEPENDKERFTQHAFGFMMYTGGMRVGDFLSLKINNIHYDKGFILKYKMSKSGRPMEVKLRLEALEYLIPFIEGLEGVNLDGYKEYKQTIYLDHIEELKEAEEEYNSIEVKSLGSLKHSTLADLIKIYNTELKKEVEKKKRKDFLLGKIESRKISIPENKKRLKELIGNEIMKVQDKDLHIFPLSRVNPLDDITENRIKVSMHHVYNKIKKKQDIKTTITNHQARHVFAQRLFEQGENFHHISLALGHSSLSITESYREQLITDEARDVIDQFNPLL